MSKDHTWRSDAPPSQVLYTVKQLADAEPALGVGAIREDLFYRETNGLEESGAIVQRGRRLLIHRERYLAWLIEGRAAQTWSERPRRVAAVAA